MMRIASRRGWIVAAAAALTISGGVFAADAATADAADAPSSLVEDYSYPGAAAILAAHNVKLISGNGKIVYADCSNPPAGDVTFVYVYTTDLSVNGGDAVCFQVLGVPGVLTMEVPQVFEIRGDGRVAGAGKGHDMTAVVQPEGGSATTVQLDSDGSTPVGIGTDPTAAPTTLLQLTAVG